MKIPTTILGIDFSGAVDAGRRVWITEGEIQGNRLKIKKCLRGDELPTSGQDRDRCLQSLQKFISKNSDCAFGLDFSFGLPEALVDERSWSEFILTFPRKYRSAEAFRLRCRAAEVNGELKRLTDRESRTPFCPYNLRIYRQTYYGICKLLFPLVKSGKVCVVPMQPLSPGKAWIFEICPASLLKSISLYQPYKGKTRNHLHNRRQILKFFLDRKTIFFSGAHLLDRIIHNSEGDALDSLLAAIGTFRTLHRVDSLYPVMNSRYAREGVVYF